uniref:Ornithine decarboxylase antizyme 2b n=1 Tax=Electrophorus electricus TaxID=8005 RepID=A0A4W4GJS5_ELEEL
IVIVLVVRENIRVQFQFPLKRSCATQRRALVWLTPVCTAPGSRLQGLCGAPDAPHPLTKIPGGRGTGRDLSLSVPLHKDDRLTVTQAGPASGTPPILHFQYQLSERRFSCWETVLAADCLYLEIPSGALPDGSKEGLTSLLEFAEERLKVSYVFVWFYKTREDRLSITKTFHYMGFEMVKPGHPLVPARPDLFFMVYSMDDSSSDEE